MKKVIFCVLMLLGVIGASAQDLQGTHLFLANKAQLFQTYTTYTATSDDTTDNFVSLTIDPVLKTDVLLASEVRLIGVATDSVAADVYVIGSNSFLTSLTETYADSLVGTSNTSNIAVITLRSSTIDRLAGKTRLKVGTVFRATGQGTTAGRTTKWYILWKR